MEINPKSGGLWIPDPAAKTPSAINRPVIVETYGMRIRPSATTIRAIERSLRSPNRLMSGPIPPPCRNAESSPQ